MDVAFCYKILLIKQQNKIVPAQVSIWHEDSIRKTISDLTDTVSPEFISLLTRQYS